MTVVDLETNSITFRIRYSETAERGINSISIVDDYLLVENCSVGRDDSNLWLFEISSSTNIMFLDAIDLKDDLSRPQSFNFDALPGQEFAAELVEFSVQADSATQTYHARVAVTVPDGAVILPGMVARVVSSTQGDAAQVMAPLSAIAVAPDGAPFVWLVDDTGKVFEQMVTLSEASGSKVVVTSGLAGGDTVVSAGVSEIIDGMTIRPILQVGN